MTTTIFDDTPGSSDRTDRYLASLDGSQLTDTEKNMEAYRKLEELSKAVRSKQKGQSEMSEIPEGDKKLISDLQGLLSKISKLRTDLYRNPRPGCACDGKSICAHHAEVYNRLDQAYDTLVLASSAARRVE